MSKFVSHFELVRSGLLHTTSSVASYTDFEDTHPFLFTAANYGHGLWYFESTLLSDGTNTVYAALFNASGTQLTNSEISSTASTATLVRSAAITMVDADVYHQRVKTSTTITTDWGSDRPRIIFEANQFEKDRTQTEILVFGDQEFPFDDWGLGTETVVSSTDSWGEGEHFLFNDDRWEPNTQFFYEACIWTENASFPATSGLVRKANSTSVTGATSPDKSVVYGSISTSSTTIVRLRSGVMNLQTDMGYTAYLNSAAVNEVDACYMKFAKIIAVVPSSQKMELHHPMASAYFSANQTSYVKYVNSRVAFDPAKWDTDNIQEIYFETLVEADPLDTITQALSVWTGPTTDVGTITGTEISTTSTVPIVIRTGNLKSTLVALGAVTLQARRMVSGGTDSDVFSGGKLIFVYSQEADTFDLSLKDVATGFDVNLRQLTDIGVAADHLTLTESVTAYKDVTYVYFQYRVQGEVDWIETDPVEISAAGAFDETVTDLLPDTTYEYRAVVSWNNGGNIDYGEILEFTTEADTAATVDTNDTFTLTESVTVLLIHFNSVADTFALTESVTTQRSTFAAVDDNFALTESVQLEVVRFISAFDTFALTEATTQHVSTTASVSDNFALTDAITVTLVQETSVFDTFTITEAQTRELTLLRLVGDDFALTESVASDLTQNYTVEVADTFTLTESHSEELVHFVSAVDNFTLTEAVVNEVNTTVSVVDNFAITESVGVVTSFSVEVFDTFTITESTTQELNQFRSTFEVLDLTELIATQVSTTVSVFDTFTLTDALLAALAFEAPIQIDNFALTESVDIKRNVDQVVSDDLALTESITTEVQTTVSVFDTFTITESVAVTRVITPATLGDDFTLTESVQAELVHQRSVFDTFDPTDVATIEFTGAIEGSAADNFALTESVTVFRSVDLVVSDSFALTENIESSVSGTASVFDTFALSESVTLEKVLNQSAEDNFTITEAVTLAALIVYQVSVFDTVDIQEAVINEVHTTTSVFDAFTLMESVSMNQVFLAGGLFDTFSLTDVVTDTETIRFSPEAPQFRPKGRMHNTIPRGRGAAEVSPTHSGARYEIRGSGKVSSR